MSVASGFEFVSANVPPSKNSPPLKVFAPLNVSVAAPAFVKENAPPNAPPSTTPLAVVNVVSAVKFPAPLKVNNPLLVVLPNVITPPRANPFERVRAVVPSLATVPPLTVSTPVPSAELLPMETFPAVTVVPPVKVFAPLSVRVPSFTFVIEPLPPITPLRITEETSALTVVAPSSVAPAVNVRDPVPNPPKTAPGPNEYGFAIVRAVPSLTSLPLLTVSDPLPRALSLPRMSHPPVTVVPPLNVFAPLSVSLPSFAFVSDPLPPITPLRITEEISTFTVFTPLSVVFAVKVNAPVW
jgi:hypothetical protein